MLSFLTSGTPQCLYSWVSYSSPSFYPLLFHLFPKLYLSCISLTNSNCSASWEQSFLSHASILPFSFLSMPQIWQHLFLPTIFRVVTFLPTKIQQRLFFLCNMDCTDGDSPMQPMSHSCSTKLSFQQCSRLQHLNFSTVFYGAHYL